MMKNVERGPALPASARARAERKAARRSARRVDRPHAFTAGYWVRTVLIAAAIGFVGFSLQWPNMPFAAYVGVALGLAVLAILVGIRLLQRRGADRA
jgi:hypothetical protein